jgi:lysophospholipase L1-like esterase
MSTWAESHDNVCFPSSGLPPWIKRFVPVACVIVGLFSVVFAASNPTAPNGSTWIGTWGSAPQAALPGKVQTYHNQTLRLIVHVSAGGNTLRVRISNTFGDRPLFIGAAHIARRTSAAEIDPTSDRSLKFHGHASVKIPAGSMVMSDPVAVDLQPLSDLAVSLFLPEDTAAKTLHILAQQTSYLSTDSGDSTAAVKFPVAKQIHTWPFLSGVEVKAPTGATIVAFGSSTTDGDGSTSDANRRWPDVLAEELLKDTKIKTTFGVLNEGIIGNRLLEDSPTQTRFGSALGQAGLRRFQRDVLTQAGVRYVFMALGVNDMIFPGSFTPAMQKVDSASIIAGYRQLVARAHQKGIKVIGTTIPPFENATFDDPEITNIYTPEKESVRQEVNKWIMSGGGFDAVVDFDAVLRDPDRPTRLLPAFDSGDHLHMNDAGYVACAKKIPLNLFDMH